MFCIYCGTPNPDDAVFCRSCGRQQKSVDEKILPVSPLPSGSPSGVVQPSDANIPIVRGSPQLSSVPVVQGTSLLPSTPSTDQRVAQHETTSVTSHSSSQQTSSPQASFDSSSQPSHQLPTRTLPPPIHPQHDLGAQLSPASHQQTPTQHPLSGDISEYSPSRRLAADAHRIMGRLSRRAVVLSLVGAGSAAIAGTGLTVAVRTGLLKFPGSSSSSGNPTFVSANSPMFGFNPQGTRFNPDEHILGPDNVSRLSLSWKKTFQYSDMSSTPAIVDGVVYIGSAGDQVNGQPSGDRGKLYALNAKTGSTLWAVETGAVGSSPAVVDGMVYVSSNSQVYALNATTGNVLWTSLGSGSLSSPIVANGVVYIGLDDNNLYALNASTGRVLWMYPIEVDSLDVSPAVSSGVVYIGSLDNVYALNSSTGAVLWTYAAEGSSPAVANGMVYINLYRHSESIYAFDAATGAVRWTYATGNALSTSDYVGASSPAVANGVVYIGSADGKVYALNATTWSLLWSYQTGGAVGSSPLVANGVVYIGSSDGKVYALNATNGSVLWSYQAGGIVNSSPVVVNGMVYAASFREGTLYAFSLPA